MALLHAATLSPSKAEAVAALLAAASWGPDDVGDLTLLGAFRFDDPEGRVGVETHLARVGGTVWHVPVTYRDAPLEDAAQPAVVTMEHSVLGTRWLYDGAVDPVYLSLVASAALTGVGQGVELRTGDDGRRSARGSRVRLTGGGWPDDWVPVDGWGAPEQDGTRTALRSPEWRLDLERRPTASSVTSVGYPLSATWPGQDSPALLARVERRA